MVSKNRRKRVTRLHLKKYRDQEGLFIAEGAKVAGELLEQGFVLEECWLVSSAWQNVDGLATRSGEWPEFLEAYRDRCVVVSESEMKSVSQMTHPPGLLAVFQMPQPCPIDYADWMVAVDRLRDPGNLGTLIRSCDWFGIRHLLCSEGTADVFNHKVVQASMGAVGRVQVHYVDLVKTLAEAPIPVFGTYLEGDNLYTAALPEAGILLFGNESQGIHPDYQTVVARKLHIPGMGERRVESLNIGVSAGIFLSEIRRGTLSRG